MYRWALVGDASLCLADVADVDSTVARSIRQLVSVVEKRKRLEMRLDGSELEASLESVTLDGCRICDLGLDFTLPGHPSIELRKGGKDIPVTIHNLEDYIKVRRDMVWFDQKTSVLSIINFVHVYRLVLLCVHLLSFICGYNSIHLT